MASPLDRETESSYTLYVSANDNPGDRDNQRSNQTGNIVIVVTDINDNDPVFTNSEYKATVLENESPGRLIFTMSAEDKDSGVNGELVYGLLGDARVLEMVHITTVRGVGEIRVKSAGSLIGLSGKHMLTVTVRDKGSSPRSAQTSLELFIEDVNIHPPVFVKPSGTVATITADEVSGTAMYYM